MYYGILSKTALPRGHVLLNLCNNAAFLLSGALLTRRAAQKSQMSQLSEVMSGGLAEIHRGQEGHAHSMNKELDVMSDAIMTKVGVCCRSKKLSIISLLTKQHENLTILCKCSGQGK